MSKREHSASLAAEPQTKRTKLQREEMDEAQDGTEENSNKRVQRRARANNKEDKGRQVPNNNEEENICAACAKPIKERYLLMALDKQWHEDCLKCDGCNCRLGEVGRSLFTRANKILCRTDFLRIFGQRGRCAACNKEIPPYEMVMRANELAYHMDCFACQHCHYRFCVGDQFHLTDVHRIICVACRTRSPATPSSGAPIDTGQEYSTASGAETNSDELAAAKPPASVVRQAAAAV